MRVIMNMIMNLLINFEMMNLVINFQKIKWCFNNIIKALCMAKWVIH